MSARQLVANVRAGCLRPRNIRAGYRREEEYSALGRAVAERFADPETDLVLVRRAEPLGPGILSLDIEGGREL